MLPVPRGAEGGVRDVATPEEVGHDQPLVPCDLLYSVVKGTHDVLYSLKRLLNHRFLRVKIRKKLVDRSFKGCEMTSNMFDRRF